MIEKKKILVWIFPLLVILFLAVIMLKQAPDTFVGDNVYLADVEDVDPDLLKYQELDGIVVELKQLYALAIDVEDQIYVAGDNRLLILRPDGSQLHDIKLTAPARCLNIAGGNIYVGFKDHIEIYDQTGKQLAGWGQIDEKSTITALAAVGNMLFVADAGTRNVWKFDLNGKLLGKIAVENKGEGIPKLIVPSPYFDLVAAGNGTIWVVNPGRHQLENFTVDGKLTAIWGKYSPEIEGFCGCCNPIHIAILKDGSFVTAEKGHPRVKTYDSKGTFTGVVAGGNQFKEGTKGLDLAVDTKDRILVLDPKMSKIRVFIRK